MSLACLNKKFISEVAWYRDIPSFSVFFVFEIVLEANVLKILLFLLLAINDRLEMSANMVDKTCGKPLAECFELDENRTLRVNAGPCLT